MTAPTHPGECTHLPGSFLALVERARAVCDSVQVDRATGRAQVSLDLFRSLDDLEAITGLAEREIVAVRAAT
jgi:hypothetical protein